MTILSISVLRLQAGISRDLSSFPVHGSQIQGVAVIMKTGFRSVKIFQTRVSIFVAEPYHPDVATV